MAFFKRPEVWVLLLLSAAGIAWVLWSDESHDKAAIEAEPSVPEESGVIEDSRFAIRERRISREEDHLILTIRIDRNNSTAVTEPLELVEPGVRLVTDDGDAISPFFLPSDPAPKLDSDSGASAELRYWLPISQIPSALWLEIDGDRLAVKEVGDVSDFEQKFPEGIEVAVNGLDWLP